MSPSPKNPLPPNLPRTWKYGNRNLKPGLAPASREEYKGRIITPRKEPAWSRRVHFINLLLCGSLLSYMIFFADYGSDGTVVSKLRDKADSWWAQNWYISSYDRKKYLEARAKQDERIREQERLLDEKIAARNAAERHVQTA